MDIDMFECTNFYICHQSMALYIMKRSVQHNACISKKHACIKLIGKILGIAIAENNDRQLNF